jgi:hypothetical protein
VSTVNDVSAGENRSCQLAVNQTATGSINESRIAAVATINDSELRGLIGDCVTSFNDSVRDEQLISMKKQKAVKSAHSTPPPPFCDSSCN